MAVSSYEKRGSGDFATVATLSQKLEYFTDLLIVTDIVYDEGPSDVTVGMGVMIDEEILRITEIVAPGAQYRVARGCADTRPWEHIAGADVWFFEDAVGTDGRVYAGGEEIGTKALPWTHSGGTLRIEKSPPEAVTFNWRFYRPYLPGRMTHGVVERPWFEKARFGYDEGGLVLRWTHRDRLLQADQLIDHFQANIGPEPGVTYKAQVYDSEDNLLRTEVGIAGNEWVYPWVQAMGDFGMAEGTTDTANGYLEFMARRDSFDSWQFYVVPFELSAEGPSVMVAMLAQQIAQQPTDGGDEGGGQNMRAATVAMLGEQVVSGVEDGAGGDDGALPSGAMLAHLQQDVVTGDSLFAPLNRIWFEAPYTYLIRRYGMAPFSPHIVSGVARTSDRLADDHSIWSKLREELGAEYARKDLPPWCAWATLAKPLTYLQEDAEFDRSSLFDGVALDNVRAGHLALIGSELVIVRSIDQVAKKIVFGRGSVDTIPHRHSPGSRIWFFEADCGIDEGPFPDPVGNDARVPVDLKAVPRGAGVEPPHDKFPVDLVRLSLRKQRPFPPGRLLVNGNPWFEGGMPEQGRPVVFTFTQRNRLTQRDTAYDHNHASIPHERGTTYVFAIRTRVTNAQGAAFTVTIREDRVIGERYEYTWDMAVADGYRLASLFDRCGRVTARMTVDAERDGLLNWQGYDVQLVLPAPPCRNGQVPGGGVPGPVNPNPGPGGGAGEGNNNGGNNDSPGTGGESQPPSKPEDPFDNGEGDNGDSGTGELPDDGEGEVGMYWDYNWDTFYAAKKRGGDNIGE